jgi:hypothetical protein
MSILVRCANRARASVTINCTINFLHLRLFPSEPLAAVPPSQGPEAIIYLLAGTFRANLLSLNGAFPTDGERLLYNPLWLRRAPTDLNRRSTGARCLCFPSS